VEGSAYCRHARQLRWRHANDPHTLYQALLDLSRRADATAGTGRYHDAPLDALRAPQPGRPLPVTPDRVHVARVQRPSDTGIVFSPRGQAFADRVEGVMDDPLLLAHATRRNLLATAAALGIEPFEANLIIALLQHRARARAHATAPSAPRSRPRLPALAVCFALEAAALLTWYVLS
jgi:hypothetical protein